MDRIACSSCGGALQKVAGTQYRCLFCGTAHELDVRDAPMRALMDENNARWHDINRRMEQFFSAVNYASTLDHTRRKLRTPFFVLNVAGIATIAWLVSAMRTALASQSRAFVPSDLAPILAVAGFFVVVNVMLLISWTTARSRHRRAMSEARELVTDALASYREMSTRPPKEILGALHNRRLLQDDEAEALAFRLYDEAAAAA